MTIKARPPYSKPPIVEAIIDFRVDPQSLQMVKSLEKVHKAVLEHFPLIEDFNKWESISKLEKGKEAHSTTEVTHIGYLLRDSQGTKLVQLSNEGLTLSYLNQYSDWNTFIADARLLWQAYSKFCNNSLPKRIGVRFINKIRIPEPIGDIDEYFYTIPKIAPSLPQEMRNFFMQINIPYQEQNAEVVITQTVLPKEEQEYISFLLDIDASILGGALRGESDIWEKLSSLRSIKNEVFESCITEKARKLFD